MERIKCPVCGEEYENMFCPGCGTPRSRGDNPEPAPAPTRNQLTFEDLAPSVYEFTDRAREKQSINRSGEIQMVINEAGDLRLVIVSGSYADIYVGRVKRDRPCDIGLRREDGGMIGSGTAPQFGFSVHVINVGNGLIRLRADVLPPPIMFAGLDYHLERVEVPSEIRIPETAVGSGQASPRMAALGLQTSSIGAPAEQRRRTCAYCGFETHTSGRFCPECGRKLET